VQVIYEAARRAKWHFLGDSLGMQAQQYRQLPAYLNALAKNNPGVITRLLIKRSCQDVPEVLLVRCDMPPPPELASLSCCCSTLTGRDGPLAPETSQEAAARRKRCGPFWGGTGLKLSHALAGDMALPQSLNGASCARHKCS
jgi:hypothetical protein